MSTDPVMRLPAVLGNVLARLRRERGWDAEALANASGLSEPEILGIEAGSYAPTLNDFFRLAIGLGESPVILLTEVITAWRTAPADYPLYRSRPSDLIQLYRLGYFRDPGDFRELPRVYESLDHATADARRMNVVRVNKERVPIDTLTIYIRVGYVQVASRPDAEESP